jgi:hypothetical protein
MSSPWGTAARSAVVSMKAIMTEQSTNPSLNFLVPGDLVDPNDSDFGIPEANEEDIALARVLQQIEDEETALRVESSLGRVNNFNGQNDFMSKISCRSRYGGQESNMHHSSANQTGSQTSVRSSSMREAEAIESELKESGVDVGTKQMFKGGVTMLSDGRFVSKHDALLNSLSNSVKLTELEGVGDLHGSGLLVNNTVANAIRSSTQKKKNSKAPSSRSQNGHSSGKDGDDYCS